MTDDHSRRVLIVDDNRSAADTLATLVRLLGHYATVAYDGQTGVEMALFFRPQLILCDLVMPDFDGFAVARTLREMGVDAQIVALTAFTQPAFIETAEASGFDKVLSKPATADQLASLLLH
jgi:CheY-like chemotaxis protein